MAKCDATKQVTAKYLQRICHYFCTLSTISYSIHLTSSGWSCWRHLCLLLLMTHSMASVRVHLLWVSHGSRMQCKCINNNNNSYYSSRRRRRQKSCHHFWFCLIERSMSGKSTPSHFNRVLVSPVVVVVVLLLQPLELKVQHTNQSVHLKLQFNKQRLLQASCGRVTEHRETQREVLDNNNYQMKPRRPNCKVNVKERKSCGYNIICQRRRNDINMVIITSCNSFKYNLKIK